MEIKDMPKLEAPFKRKFDEKGRFLVYDEINPGYEWVFNEQNTLALEKLDGTCVSIIIENSIITRIYNRENRIHFFQKGCRHIIEGLQESFERGYMDLLDDGQHFGELIGEKVGGNPYKLTGHIWIPFNTFGKKHLAYKSWGKYPKDFATLQDWIVNTQMALFTLSRGIKDGFAEGVVFYRANGEMAKLRKDMFPLFYEKNPSAHQHKEA